MGSLPEVIPVTFPYAYDPLSITKFMIHSLSSFTSSVTARL